MKRLISIFLPIFSIILSQSHASELPECRGTPSQEWFIYNASASPLLAVRPGTEKIIFDHFLSDSACRPRTFALNGRRHQTVTEVEFMIEYENPHVFYWELLVRCYRAQASGINPTYHCEVISGL